VERKWNSPETASTRKSRRNMDTRNTEKQKRQNRARGKCWGCGTEGVELVSSRWAEGAQQKICDACRKAIANHPELDPAAVLASRRQPGARLVTRDKLITLNSRLTGLINALHRIGADECVRDAIRTLVEPYLSPIAADIWPKEKPGTSPGPDVVPKVRPVEYGITEIVIPDEGPPEPKPKKGTTPEFKARKAWASHNNRRMRKGLPPLTKEAYLAGER
jgi:hypothetical protein